MKKIYPVMFVVSVSLAVAAGILLAVYGLQFGIDFKGGSVLEVTFEGERPTPEALESSLQELSEADGLSEFQLTPVGEGGMLMRSMGMECYRRHLAMLCLTTPPVVVAWLG